MTDIYEIQDTADIVTPALLIFEEPLLRNIDKMIAIAGDASRLRPHCKTHKMAEVTKLEMARGITKHKCATLAEAEMLAEEGVKDIFLAYNPVGANIARVVKFQQQFPDVLLHVTADHAQPVQQLGAAITDAGQKVRVLLDVDSGMGRTGVQVGPDAVELYRLIDRTPGLVPVGLHLYDGQNHQTDLDERTNAVKDVWEQGLQLREMIANAGLQVEKFVAGGTGSFPIFAEIDDPILELSPGTTVLHDAGYREMYPDMDFEPAALLLTRVISKPGVGRITVDLGYKACASDPPAGNRLRFPSLPDAREVQQSEEHLVVETEQSATLQPGDELLAIPRHICPTTAMHKQATLIRAGHPIAHWPITARDRKLTV